MVKDLFHTVADERRAHLLSVVGLPGMGKSRLAWEFEKYIDGLAETPGGTAGAASPTARASRSGRWPRWCGCARGSPRTNTRRGAREARGVLAEIVPDPEERAFVEPRLQHLLGLTDRVAPDREDLFSAWRLFVERMADQFPVIMVFEDIHWADAALIEFSSTCSTGRAATRSTWSRSRGRTCPSGTRLGRRPAQLHLALPRAAPRRRRSTTCSRGLVPGLPGRRRRGSGSGPTASRSTRSRPSGCCSTEACSSAEDEGYRVTGDLDTLDVPETLHALIAARLDGLPARGAPPAPGRRRARQDLRAAGPRGARRGRRGRQSTPRSTPSSRKEMLVARHRSPLARARPVRLRPGTDPARRLRDAVAPRTGRRSTSPRPRYLLGARDRPRRDRRGDRHPLPRRLPGRAGRPDAAEIKAEAREWLTRAAERAAALAAPTTRSAPSRAPSS